MKTGGHPGLRQHGFTIVELLIVVVVIGVIASITIIAFSNVQLRARDAQRKDDIANIAKALELYHTDNGSYPPGVGSTTINDNWSTTNDASWANLETALSPYVKKLPSDPKPSTGSSAVSGTNLGYAYYSNHNTAYCGAGIFQVYILVYRLESGAQVNTFTGGCTTSPLGPYSNHSNYRVSKGT